MVGRRTGPSCPGSLGTSLCSGPPIVQIAGGQSVWGTMGVYRSQHEGIRIVNYYRARRSLVIYVSSMSIQRFGFAGLQSTAYYISHGLDRADGYLYVTSRQPQGYNKPARPFRRREEVRHRARKAPPTSRGRSRSWERVLEGSGGAYL